MMKIIFLKKIQDLSKKQILLRYGLRFLIVAIVIAVPLLFAYFRN
jgi:hypothetical protein